MRGGSSTTTTACTHAGNGVTEFLENVVLDRKRAVLERHDCSLCRIGGVCMPVAARALPNICGHCYAKNAVLFCRRAALKRPSAHMLMGCTRCGRSFHILRGSGLRRTPRPCWAENSSQEDICADCETALCKRQARLCEDNARYFSKERKRVMFTLLLVRKRLKKGPYTVGAIDTLVWHRIFLYSL